MNKFAGTVAVVTGASAGIGRGIAERLCEEGLSVVGLSRRKVDLENDNFSSLQCDVGNAAEVQDAFS